MKTIGILQPSYLPWLGFFEQTSRCDVFVYLDDVQYTKNDWRNRNRIKTKDGLQWLTVPVSYKSGQNIKDAHINNSLPWPKKHLKAVKTWYPKSTFYEMYIDELEKILKKNWKFLVDLDVELIEWLIKQLGLNIKTIFSSELSIGTKDKQLRIIEMCKALDCDRFYEGKSGQNYIDIEVFKTHTITVEFQDYNHPYYNQLWVKDQGFISHLSVIDLLFNCGPDSLSILSREKIITLPASIKVRHADELKKS